MSDIEAKLAAATASRDHLIMEQKELCDRVTELTAELAAERERAASAVACCDSYALENQQFHDRFTLAEARVAKLREALDGILVYMGDDKETLDSLMAPQEWIELTSRARAVLKETKGGGDG